MRPFTSLVNFFPSLYQLLSAGPSRPHETSPFILNRLSAAGVRLMISERQLNANRRNAQLSTGPRTPEGRAAVSQNALRHGLASQTTVLPNENPEEFRELRDALFDEYDPSGPTETLLVEQMAMAAWRLRRLRAVETGLFALRMAQLPRDENDLDPRSRAYAYDASGSRAIDSLTRYETRIERSFYRALHELQKLRSASPENNSENQTHSRNRTPVEPAGSSSTTHAPEALNPMPVTAGPLPPQTRSVDRPSAPANSQSPLPPSSPVCPPLHRSSEFAAVLVDSAPGCAMLA